MELRAGSRLGHYEITSRLGEGGMGVVYEAVDTRLGRRVAVKVLSPHLLTRPDALERFEREARVVAALSHPNIVILYDIGREGDLSFVVTELLEGETLRDRLDRSSLSWRESAEIGVAVCNGLSAAHSRGIVHRDLKPENIFLTHDGQVRLLDFGLARLEESKTLPLAPTAETFLKTPTGLILGTVGYMAPEQVRGEVAQPASDLFAFGCVLYEMVTGRQPFGARTPAESMHDILKSDPPAIDRDEVPRQLEELIFRCLEKDPRRRFQSAHDVGLTLRTILAEPAGVKRPREKREKRADLIAVLPFSGDEILGEALSDALINALVEQSIFRVVPRSTVARFRASEVEPAAAGRTLKVPLVLSGRVGSLQRKRLVQAELIHVEDGAQLWGQQFATEAEDFASEIEELARKIAIKVQERAGPKKSDRKRKSAKAKAISSETLQLVNNARIQIRKGSAESLRRGIELLHQAIQRTPDNSAAYAAFADGYVQAALQSFVSPEEVRGKALQAAQRAIELAPEANDTQAALGSVQLYFEWDRDSSARSLQRAIDLNESDAYAHLRRAELSVAGGDSAHAIAEADRAVSLDPGSAWTIHQAGLVHYLVRQFERATEYSHRATILDPEYDRARITLALAMAERALFDEAHQQLLELTRREPEEVEANAALGYLYAKWNREAGATKIATRLATPGRPRYLSPYLMARIYAALGDDAAVRHWLQRAYREKAPHLVWLYADPAFQPFAAADWFVEFGKWIRTT